MTDDELAMAYADGELDEIAARRFEQRMRETPDLAATVRGHQALRDTLARGYSPIVDAPLPERLTALLRSNVVELGVMRRRFGGWRAAASMAACLVAGVAIGQFWQMPSAGVSGDRLIASASLARVLDQQLAGHEGSTRVLVTFRDRQGSYCRVFEGPEIGGIACREESGWAVRRTQANPGRKTAQYRQASSGDSDLLTAAQNMMVGDPLDSAAERSVRDDGWGR